jgi:hypothetical protein
MSTKFNVQAAQTHLAEAKRLIGEGKAEDVLRHNLSSRLPEIFPDRPWWVEYHILGTEKHVKFEKGGKVRSGFVDALVGATAIEYEKDLSNPTIFDTGLGQVKDYCASLLNEGDLKKLIVGVLSDTLRWRAYRIKEVRPLSSVQGATKYGREHLDLEEIDQQDFSAAGTREAMLLGEFLTKHLGREGARRLDAETLSFDLGFESRFCRRHIAGIRSLVDKAFASNKDYADLIEKLWTDFVSYLGSSGATGGFDRETYVAELYIMSLAKLLCANVLEVKALASDDGKLASILDGQFFKVRGLANLVEYDYFGWLTESPHLDSLLPVARAMQDDLRAYDFVSAPAEDIFGALMAQLANRSQRLLLGQELTPAWLAEKVVGKVFDELPGDDDPRLVDMCCGSGAMVVEAVKLAAKRLEAAGVAAGAAGMKRLSMVITGFDIDPLAVILAKVGWVLAARAWLAGLSPGEISIPVYHADSLFAATPLAKTVDADSGATHYELRLDDKVLGLPGFLVSSKHRGLFDTLLDRGYTMAMASADQASSTLTGAAVETLVRQALEESGDNLTAEEEAETLAFCKGLLDSLDALQRAGRNGIWVFVLRNSYRPGLVTGQFNGLVSNPPWLALSKVADNPYKDALRVRAEDYGIKPEGSSHLHIELATIFLLHAIERYLASNAVVGCVLPESVLSAHHHNPFRKADYLGARKPVPFIVNEIWRVEKGTFKNEAIVLFGHKNIPAPAGAIPGKLASPAGLANLTFHRVSQGRRTAWADKAAAGAGKYGFFNPAEFREGADVMPRTLVFHGCTRVPGMASKWNLRAIDRSTGALRYLVSGAKKYKAFNLTANSVDDKFVFDVLLSHQLTPFSMGDPAKGFLPIEKNEVGQWISVPETSLAAFGAATFQAFDAIFKAIGPTFTSQQYFEKLDSNRRKLSSQSLPTEGWLVFMGAGGDLVCAAHRGAQTYRADKTVIDQTLYWAAVPTEDEALYLIGLLNSEAVNLVIKEFQPRGQFGARHVHKVPLGATPPFNPADVAHADVVVKTRNLLADWNALNAMDPGIPVLLNPNNSKLQIRRAKLRLKLKGLNSYADYELACKSLYGV